jgi:hypothetical protein
VIFLKNKTQLVLSLLAVLVMSTVIFLVLPLQFQGPETFKGCTAIHVSSCSFNETIRWHWFGMYHVIFSPSGTHFPAVMKYRLVNRWKVLIAGCAATITSLAIIGLTGHTVSMRKRHYKNE